MSIGTLVREAGAAAASASAMQAPEALEAEAAASAASAALAEAAAAVPAPWHESLGYFSLLAFIPAAVFAVRWLAQRRLQQLMMQPSPEAAPDSLAELAAPEVRSSTRPTLVLHDAAHGVPDAVAAREAFVARALGLFRRVVLVDVVAGLAYVGLLLVLGRTDTSADRNDLALGLVMIGSIYPLMAGLRYLLYRKQFRAVDTHFRAGWVMWIPVWGGLLQLRWLLGPRWQALSAGVWAAMMFIFGLGWALMDEGSPAWHAAAAVLAGAAVLHAALAWWALRRLQREPGVRLLVLRVFGIDANARFVFGRMREFWRHFGATYTVLDPALWRERYPLASLRTLAFTLALMVACGFLLGFGEGLGLGAYAPWFALAAATAMLAVYAGISFRLLRREFIRSRAQLQKVLAALARRPRNADLTFRNLEAMCHDDTWKIAVSEFARGAEVVLMDLRGFSEARKGCQYEVDYLLDVVPIGRVLFLVDAASDLDPVRRLLHERWEMLRSTSPNLQGDAPRIHLYACAAQDERDVQGILDLLIHIASGGPLPAARPAPVALPLAA